MLLKHESCGLWNLQKPPNNRTRQSKHLFYFRRNTSSTRNAYLRATHGYSGPIFNFFERGGPHTWTSRMRPFLGSVPSTNCNLKNRLIVTFSNLANQNLKHALVVVHFPHTEQLRFYKGIELPSKTYRIDVLSSMILVRIQTDCPETFNARPFHCYG